MSNQTKCYVCQGDLAIVNGEMVFAEWVDPVGNVNRMHKSCHERAGYKGRDGRPPAETAYDEMKRQGNPSWGSYKE